MSKMLKQVNNEKPTIGMSWRSFMTNMDFKAF